MSAWTWTYVKSNKIPSDIVETICKDAIKDISSVWYMDESKPFEKILERWFEMYDDKDYFINDCGLQPFELEHNVLEKRLKDKISEKKTLIADLELVKNGSQSLDACLRKHEVWEDIMGEPRCYLIDDEVWVKVPEIFRLQDYSNMTVQDGIKTVDSLLEYLSEHANYPIYDYQGSNGGKGLTEALKSRIKEYYGRFGDGNFSLYFG